MRKSRVDVKGQVLLPADQRRLQHDRCLTLAGLFLPTLSYPNLEGALHRPETRHHGFLWFPMILLSSLLLHDSASSCHVRFSSNVQHFITEYDMMMI